MKRRILCLVLALFFIAGVFSQNMELPRRFDSKAFNLPIVHGGLWGSYAYSDGTAISRKNLDKILASVEGNEHYIGKAHAYTALAYTSLAIFCACGIGCGAVALSDGSENTAAALALCSNFGGAGMVVFSFGVRHNRDIAVDNYNAQVFRR